MKKRNFGGEEGTVQEEVLLSLELCGYWFVYNLGQASQRGRGRELARLAQALPNFGSSSPR